MGQLRQGGEDRLPGNQQGSRTGLPGSQQPQWLQYGVCEVWEFQWMSSSPARGGGGGTSCTPVGYREVPQVRQLGTYSEGVEQNNLVEQSVSTDSLGA